MAAVIGLFTTFILIIKIICCYHYMYICEFFCNLYFYDNNVIDIDKANGHILTLVS